MAWQHSYTVSRIQKGFGSGPSSNDKTDPFEIIMVIGASAFALCLLGVLILFFVRLLT